VAGDSRVLPLGGLQLRVHDVQGDVQELGRADAASFRAGTTRSPPRSGPAGVVRPADDDWSSGRETRTLADLSWERPPIRRGVPMTTKKLLGLAAVSKLADVVPRRRSWWQRATEPENLLRIVVYGAGVGLAGFALKKLYDRLRQPIEESIERSRELSGAVTEIAEAAKATTDATAEAESNAGKTIASIEELGRQLADGEEEASEEEAIEEAPAETAEEAPEEGSEESSKQD